MSKEQIAVAELIFNIILGKTGSGRVNYFPQKQDFPFDAPYEQPFERATPESQGISSEYLAALIRELYHAEGTEMHHFMALRHGKVICECNFAPYPKGMWHITHSMCKSITGMAVGLLIQEGKLRLDENIYDIFPDKVNSLLKIFRPVITVENLLNMSSGITFNESGIVSGNDWVASYLNSTVNGTTGQIFQYNSMNTYMLSAIVTKRTGETLTEYLKPRLFQPLGITKYFWETCPAGITKGGWGLFLCAEDMAKLGQLYLQKGKWKGEQIIPESWVEASTQKRWETPDDTYGYGYQLWMEQRPGSFEFNGMLGQNVVIYPDMDMVLVTNAGNNELFQDCIMLNIIRKYFPPEYTPADTLPENPSAVLLLKRLCGELEQGMELTRPILRGGWKKRQLRRNNSCCEKSHSPAFFEKFRQELHGRTYEMRQQSIGLFPLFMQVFHNNMTDGIRKISFSCESGIFSVSFLEGEEIHTLPVGFRQAALGTVSMHGENYLVGTLGEFTRNENQIPVLKLEITFVEECAKRLLSVFFHSGKEIELRWKETPGKGMILEGLSSITEELAAKLPNSTLLGENARDLAIRLMEQTIEPVCWGDLEMEDEGDVQGDIPFVTLND